MESSAAGSSKRARAPSNGATQVPSCLVDGCTADLSKCRDYHRRHKVCEIHSKTPKVTIRGQDQRFCQQCSRFHSLVEFDEGKRSCRKRLDGHNRRRRKPQPDPLSLNSTRFLSNHQGSGTKYIPFSSPIVFSSSTITSSWSGAIKSNANDLIQHHHHSQLDFSNSNLFAGSQSSSSPLSQSYKGVRGGTKHFPFLETGASSATTTSFPSVNISSSNGLVDTNSALSLLSSSEPAESREIGLSHHVAQGDSIRLPHSTYIPCLNDYVCVGIQAEEMGGTGGGLVSDGGKVDFSGQDLFRTRADGSSSSTSGNHQTISFSWE